jgi:aspartate aminotransferase-like enzyme
LQKGQTPYTPAISLLYGLEKALEMIVDEGMEKRWERHRIGGKAMRAGIGALDLKIVARLQDASDTVTAVWIPEPWAADNVRDIMKKEYGVIVAGGQSKLAGKIVRIGHMGFTSLEDIRTTVAALESALASGEATRQKARQAVDQVLMEEGVMKR